MQAKSYEMTGFKATDDYTPLVKPKRCCLCCPHSCCGRCCCCLGFTMAVLAVLVGILLFVMTVVVGYPLHASCKIDWTIDVACSEVNQKLVAQIDLWKGEDCGTGQKCLYALDSSSPTEIKATHTTPKAKYIDDLTYNFKSTGNTSCAVNGFSTSRTWYAYLDYGTNYCNLHNLMDGAGLTNMTGYKETTSDSVCTQYTSRNCEKY